MTKEERIAARKKTMADIVAKRDAGIARGKKRSKEKDEAQAKVRAERRKVITDMQAAMKTSKEKKKALKEKRITSRKKTMAGIVAKKDATIAKEKKRRADNKAARKASLERFTSNPKAKAKTQTKSTTSKSAPRAVDRGGRLSARGSEGFKPTNTRTGPDMSTVNKPDTPRVKKTVRKAGPSGPSMTSMGGAKLKPRNKDKKVNLKKRGPSGPSMTGFYGGGTVGNTSMGRVRVAKPGNINGIAKRGLTRAKHR